MPRHWRSERLPASTAVPTILALALAGWWVVLSVGKLLWEALG